MRGAPIHMCSVYVRCVMKSTLGFLPIRLRLRKSRMRYCRAVDSVLYARDVVRYAYGGHTSMPDLDHSDSRREGRSTVRGKHRVRVQASRKRRTDSHIKSQSARAHRTINAQRAGMQSFSASCRPCPCSSLPHRLPRPDRHPRSVDVRSVLRRGRGARRPAQAHTPIHRATTLNLIQMYT